MPPVAEPTPIASVLGEPREGLSRHTFLGGNFFMLRMLNRYRNELGVTAPPHELEAAAMATERQLRADTATVRIADARRTGSSAHVHRHRREPDGPQAADRVPVSPRLAARHRPRRDGPGAVRVGRRGPDGRHRGQRQRRGPRPLRAALRRDPIGGPGADLRVGDGRPQRHADDRSAAGRALREGQPAAAARLRQVHGVRATWRSTVRPRGDADFQSGGDRVRYAIDVSKGAGTGHAARRSSDSRPSRFRWARNLGTYAAAETKRFASYYDSMAQGSSLAIARAAATID